MHLRIQFIWEVKYETALDSSKHNRMLLDSYWDQLSVQRISFSVCGEPHMLIFRNKEETVLLGLERTSALLKNKGMPIWKKLQMGFATTKNNRK